MDKAECDALLDSLYNHPNVEKAAEAVMEADAKARKDRKEQEKREAEMGLVFRQAGLPPPEKPGKRKYKLKAFAEVEYEDPRFLFSPYIPLGALTILQGDSGVGKTAFCCKLAAAVSIGGLMQDVQCEEGNMLICSVEDDPSTLRGRIEASCGDLNRCFFPEDGFDLSFMSEALDDLINDGKAELIG